MFVGSTYEPIITIDLPEDISGSVGLRTQFASATFSNLKLTVGKEENTPDPGPGTEPQPSVTTTVSASVTTSPIPVTSVTSDSTIVAEKGSGNRSIIPAILIGAGAIVAIAATAFVIIKKKR